MVPAMHIPLRSSSPRNLLFHPIKKPKDMCYNNSIVISLNYCGVYVYDKYQKIVPGTVGGGDPGAGCARYVHAAGEISYCYNADGAVVKGTKGTGGIVDYLTGNLYYCFNSAGAVVGTESVGIMVGGIVGHTLLDAVVDHCYNLGTVYGKERVGGIVGDCANNFDNIPVGGIITNCYNAGSVNGKTAVGGITGRAASVSNCYNTGSVTGNGEYVGGIAGSIGAFDGNGEKDHPKQFSISDSYNSGTVTNLAESTEWKNYTGGIAGYAVYKSKINKCYNTGKVESAACAAGGILAYGNDDVTITNCYNKGYVKAYNFAAGILAICNKTHTMKCCFNWSKDNPEVHTNPWWLVEFHSDKLISYNNSGENNLPKMENNYYSNGINYPVDWDMFSPDDDKGYKHIYEISMDDQDKFAGFDFNTVWYMDEDLGHPNLNISFSSSGDWYYGGGYTPVRSDMYINRVSDLLRFSSMVSKGDTFEGANVYLMADLDLTDVSWSAIGDLLTSFEGTFHGNGHIIKGMNARSSGMFYPAGFFARVGNKGKVQDLCIVGNVTTDNYAGGIVAFCGGTIERCAFYGDVTGTGVGAYGGIVAGLTNGTVTDCVHVGSVTSNSTDSILGGIIATNAGSVVRRNFNYGAVSGGNPDQMGGVIGINGPYTPDESEVAAGIAPTVIPQVFENYIGGTDIGCFGTSMDQVLRSDVKQCGETLSDAKLENYASYVKNWDTTNVWAQGQALPVLRQFSIPVTFKYGSKSKYHRNETMAKYLRRSGEKLTISDEAADSANYYFLTWNSAQDGNGIAYKVGFECVPSEGLVLYSQYGEVMSGWGTKDDPYLIRDAKDLVAMSNEMMADSSTETLYTGKYFRLENDIDMSGLTHIPIGAVSGRSFDGDFDGAGHTIYNLTSAPYNGGENNGLFNALNSNAVVHDLCVKGTVTSGNNAGGIAGNVFLGKIERCAFYGDVTGSLYTGGLVGSSFYGSIKNCCHIGSVTATGSKDSSETPTAGGIVGIMIFFFASPESSLVTNCHHIGRITDISSDNACCGGVVGNTGESEIDAALSHNYAANAGVKAINNTDYTNKAETLTALQLQQLQGKSGTGWAFGSVWVTGPDHPMLCSLSKQINLVYGPYSSDKADVTENKIILKSDKLTLPEVKAMAGYTFNGWDTKTDGTGERYQPGDKFESSSGTTLYAQYSRNPATYTVSPATADLGTYVWGYTDALPFSILVENTGALKEKFNLTASSNLQIVGSSSATLGGGYSIYFGFRPKPGLDAGKYNETVTVSVDSDSDPSRAKNLSVTFEVTKRPLSLGLTIDGWTYGAEANAPVLTGNAGDGAETFEYKLKTAPDTAYTADVPVNAGEYTVRAKVTETEHYKSGSVTADFTVAKANHKVTAPKALELFCSGKPQALVKAGSCKTGTILYSLSKNGTYSEEIPTATEGGEYTVWYYVEATDNYNATAKKSIKVTMTDNRLMGDVNGDGVVDLTDYSDLAKYIAEWTGYDEIVDVQTADFNNSGAPDLEDLSILAKCLSEWTGYADTYLVSVTEFRNKLNEN